jgi:hypothetical protein
LEGVRRKLVILALGAAAVAALVFVSPEGRKRMPPRPKLPAAVTSAARDRGTGGPSAEMTKNLRARQQEVLSKPCGRDPFSLSSSDDGGPGDAGIAD